MNSQILILQRKLLTVALGWLDIYENPEADEDVKEQAITGYVETVAQLHQLNL
jgi:hypothetical protein